MKNWKNVYHRSLSRGFCFGICRVVAEGRVAGSTFLFLRFSCSIFLGSY